LIALPLHILRYDTVGLFIHVSDFPAARTATPRRIAETAWRFCKAKFPASMLRGKNYLDSIET